MSSRHGRFVAPPSMKVDFLLRSAVLLGLTACRSTHPPHGSRAPEPVPALAPAPIGTTARRAPAVTAARRPVVHTYFGQSVIDDYEWLEDGQSAETRTFIEAENALARATLDTTAERSAVRERVASMLSAASRDWFGLVYEGNRLFALEEAPPKQQRVLVDLGAVTPAAGAASIKPGGERVILDPNLLDPSGKTTIDFFVPSPDGRIVAVSLSKDGTESGDVHLFDVATGKDRGETIPRVQGGTAGGSLAWTVDGKGFYYTRYPHAGERPAADLDFFQQVWFHKLGTSAGDDGYAIGKDFPRIAEIELVRSDDGKRILARVSNGDGGEVENHVLDAATGKWTRLSRFEDGISSATFGADGKVYAVSRKGAPRGKIVAFAPPTFERPESVLAEGDAVVEKVTATKGALYAIEIADGPSRVRRFPLGPKAEPLASEPKATKKGAPPAAPPPTIAPGARGLASAVLPLAPVSSVTDTLRIGDDLLVRVESHVEPPRWMLYRANEHRLSKTGLAKTSPYEMSDVEVVRESCASKDGTRVPMTVLRKRGMKLDGSAPAYLTGYGGFAVTVRPRMRPVFRVWLDHGGVVAEANLRGGFERGEAWHRAGNLTKKQNVFDDFAACARALVAHGYTRPERLAISGRSNGGLLIGATIVQHPELFRAAVAAVGIHDMLRTELSANGAFNVTEYGSVNDEAQYRALRAYSPLHNVKDDVAYPAVLFMTGANDPRVDPYHSRKMVARLQAATSSDRPILLRASNDTGHGVGTPLAAEIEETTDMLTFLLHEVAPR